MLRPKSFEGHLRMFSIPRSGCAAERGGSVRGGAGQASWWLYAGPCGLQPPAGGLCPPLPLPVPVGAEGTCSTAAAAGAVSKIRFLDYYFVNCRWMTEISRILEIYLVKEYGEVWTFACGRGAVAIYHARPNA